jgi:hypothetical protein
MEAKRIGSIYPPAIPEGVPSNSKWLLGQGSGAWFSIRKIDRVNQFNIKRFTPKGSLDCDRIFEIEDNGSIFDIEKLYEFTHVSHCAKCRIIQNGTTFIFNYIGN